MMLKIASPPYSHRAFSLIEAAIVLAIVGLVLGGIWVAASTVSKKRLYATAAQDILTLVQNTRALYPINGPANALSISSNEGISKIITKGTTLFQWSASDGLLTYPFGDQSIYGSSSGIFSVNVTTYISVDFFAMDSASSCINLASTINNKAKPPNLVSFNIYNGSTSTNFSTLPATNAAIKTACAGSMRSITFYFSR